MITSLKEDYRLKECLAVRGATPSDQYKSSIRLKAKKQKLRRFYLIGYNALLQCLLLHRSEHTQMNGLFFNRLQSKEKNRIFLF